jgi:hypothetical protein
MPAEVCTETLCTLPQVPFRSGHCEEKKIPVDLLPQRSVRPYLVVKFLPHRMEKGK